jgi:hypothetical protein
VDKTFSLTATGTDAQILTLGTPAAGLKWAVWQLTVDTIPFRPGATAQVKRNGSLFTSTYNGGRATASGPPAILIQAGDIVTVQWDQVQINDELLCHLYFEEVQLTQSFSVFGLV